MIAADAYRAPLSRVFPLAEAISSFQSGGSSMKEECFFTEKPVYWNPALPEAHFPRYSCLVLSPAELWKNGWTLVVQDDNVIETVIKQQKEIFFKTSISSSLFGVPAKETAFKHIYRRQRYLTHAATVVLERTNAHLLAQQRTHLLGLYPLHAAENVILTSEQVHASFPTGTSVYELLPVALIYIILFIYIYFSVRKMESVKSKLAMSVSALVTVFAMLMMSSGILIYHGLQQTLRSRELFPYLVAVVGFENVMVSTESVSTTTRDLGPRIRVVPGLGR